MRTVGVRICGFEGTGAGAVDIDGGRDMDRGHATRSTSSLRRMLIAFATQSRGPPGPNMRRMAAIPATNAFA